MTHLCARPRRRAQREPAEQVLARTFDQFGIRWQYEPHTFVLESRQGRVVAACTPDFYLPELDLYIECTMMRQPLTTRKNRKYRLLRERFGVNVEIMYRRDFLRLGLLAETAAGNPSGKAESEIAKADDIALL
jgi:hypothetical protein